MSSSLKNEIDPSKIETSFLWNLGLEPSFHSPVLLDFISPFPSDEPIYTSNHESNWVKKMSQWTNWSLGGMSPASGYHTEVESLAFFGHAGGKIPTSRHHVGKKPTNGYLFEHSLFFGSSSFKKWNRSLSNWVKFSVKSGTWTFISLTCITYFSFSFPLWWIYLH